MVILDSIHKFLVLLAGLSNTGGIDRGNLWAFVTASFTVLLFGVALWQLRNLNKTSRAEFNYKLTGDFFTKEARPIVFLIENKWLNFHEGSKSKAPSFSIKENEDTARMLLNKFFATGNLLNFIK